MTPSTRRRTIIGPCPWPVREPGPGRSGSWHPRFTRPWKSPLQKGGCGAACGDALAEVTTSPADPVATEPLAPSEIRSRVRAFLSMHLDSSITDPFADAPDRDALIRAKVIEALSASGWAHDPDAVTSLMDDLVGLGPLPKHMEVPEVSDILLNRWDAVYVGKPGRRTFTPTP